MLYPPLFRRVRYTTLEPSSSHPPQYSQRTFGGSGLMKRKAEEVSAYRGFGGRRFIPCLCPAPRPRPSRQVLTVGDRRIAIGGIIVIAFGVLWFIPLLLLRWLFLLHRFRRFDLVEFTALASTAGV